MGDQSTAWDGVVKSVALPPDSVHVEDLDEEIFLIYTRKQQSKEADTGLGFVQTKKDLLEISITVKRPSLSGGVGLPAKRGTAGKGKKGGSKDPDEVTVDVALGQDLGALRNRPGDTGSVLWRISLAFAKFLLQQHHFTSPSSERLFPSWSTSTILELGSGTGFLGAALYKTTKQWIFTDQLSSLDLLVSNLRRNGIANAEVREVDWVAERDEARKLEQKGQSRKQEWINQRDVNAPDMILAVDCIFNPALSEPLARTIDHLAGSSTKAVVASELRDPEPLEEFLKEWLRLGWDIWRVNFEAFVGQEVGVGVGEAADSAKEMASPSFVVWVGHRKADLQ
ncbi:hypothetical protein T439DRAFT_320078 [Meredithblackwellia eburnea MCA 4105]